MNQAILGSSYFHGEQFFIYNLLELPGAALFFKSLIINYN
jgi:hypothetical protein